jgi:hypothetical protein
MVAADGPMDGKADAAGKIPDKNRLDRGPLGWLAPLMPLAKYQTRIDSIEDH